jgi:hypothetical protein
VKAPLGLLLAVSLAAIAARASEGLALMRKGDLPAAFEALTQEARAGNALSARTLGRLLEEGAVSGRHAVPARPDEAARWYLAGYEAGDKDSAEALGALYYAGRGVPRGISESLRWFSRSRRIDALLARDSAPILEMDRAEFAAWQLAINHLLKREALFPQRAARANAWGEVAILIDAGKGATEVRKSNAIVALEEAAVAAGNAALRLAPPPAAAVEHRMKIPYTLDFRLIH